MPTPEHPVEGAKFVASQRRALYRSVGSTLLSILLLLGMGSTQATAAAPQSVASTTIASATSATAQVAAKKKMTVAEFRKATSYPAAKLSAIDPLGYYKLECVSYGGWRALHNSGVKIIAGSAVTWKKWAKDHGYVVDKTPAKGALAWYGSRYGNKHGHIAWVQSANASGTKAHLRGYGWPKRHEFDDYDVHKGKNGWPEYFLHIEKKPKKK